MNLLGVLLPMWVLVLLGTSLFSPIIDATATPHPSLSSIAGSSFPAEEELISHSFAKMGVQSPGVAEIRVVHHQDLNKKILISLIVASTLLGGILLYLSCFWIYRKRKLKNSTSKTRNCSEGRTGSSLSQIMDIFNSMRAANCKGSVAVIDYQLLESATNNFRESNILAEGNSGHIYRAFFDERMPAAVKRLKGVGKDAESELENEVNWLSKVRHQNIIKLFGYCTHGETRFIVYEMAENGSLEAQLHGPNQGSALTWHLRMKIAVDIARGLEYLHEHCNPPIVHRDLKSSNILLDSNFNAKLSDFGLAVTLGVQNNHLKLSGTPGYVAPEYLLDGKLTDKSDVYAFGVVLLELLTGKRTIEKTESAQSQSIVTLAIPQLSDRSKLPSVVDPVMRNTMDLKHLYQVAAVAVLCVQPEPSYRPLITDVLHSLIPLVPIELGGSLRITEPMPSICHDPSV